MTEEEIEWPDCVFQCIPQAVNPRCVVHGHRLQSDPDMRCMFCSGQGCGACT